MKQYPVLEDFIDKYTKKYYRQGSIYITNDSQRAEELQQNGFLGDEIKQPARKGRGKNANENENSETE